MWHIGGKSYVTWQQCCKKGFWFGRKFLRIGKNNWTRLESSSAKLSRVKLLWSDPWSCLWSDQKFDLKWFLDVLEVVLNCIEVTLFSCLTESFKKFCHSLFYVALGLVAGSSLVEVGVEDGLFKRIESYFFKKWVWRISRPFSYFSCGCLGCWI